MQRTRKYVNEKGSLSIRNRLLNKTEILNISKYSLFWFGLNV